VLTSRALSTRRVGVAEVMIKFNGRKKNISAV